MCSLGDAWFSGTNSFNVLNVQIAFPQDMETCSPKGRDCIDRNSAQSFNCSNGCEGIYADVQWVGKKIEEDVEDDEAEAAVERKMKEEVGEELAKLVYRQLADLKKEMKLMKSSGQEKGEELDKEKYKMLIAEYRKFKTENIRHFRFNSGENSSAFGKS